MGGEGDRSPNACMYVGIKCYRSALRIHTRTEPRVVLAFLMTLVKVKISIGKVIERDRIQLLKLELSYN